MRIPSFFKIVVALGGSGVVGWTVNIPASMPDDISQAVSPQFPAFAFEEASLVEYLQGRTPGGINEFSRNLMREITKRTGGRAVIRIGGTSADYGRYYPDQPEPALPVAEVFNYQSIDNTTIGPSFWQIAADYTDADYVIQLPLAGPNVSETIAWAESSVNTIGLDRIVAIELGNEPNLYGSSHSYNGTILSSPTWYANISNETYAEIFASRLDAVSKALNLPEDLRMFQAFDLAWDTAAYNPAGFDIERLYQLGIDNSSTIKIAAQHYYSGTARNASDLGMQLMNHTTIADYMDRYAKSVEFLKTVDTSGTRVTGTPITTAPGVPFIISEVGNTLNSKHLYEEQAVLGSALFQVDFQLYAMVVGISMINWQQIMHAGYDMWLPVDSGNMTAQVFSNFYAQPFVADFIGGCKTQVGYLKVEDTTSDSVQAYGAWVDGKLDRIAMVNFEVWDNNPGNGTRPVEWVNLKGLPKWVQSIDVTHLTSPDGAHANASSITYAGSQWTYESMGMEVCGVRDDTDHWRVKGGEVTLGIEASSAVMIWLKG